MRMSLLNFKRNSSKEERKLDLKFQKMNTTKKISLENRLMEWMKTMILRRE